jgi:hypothetical protein
MKTSYSASTSPTNEREIQSMTTTNDNTRRHSNKRKKMSLMKERAIRCRSEGEAIASEGQPVLGIASLSRTSLGRRET